MKPARRAAFAGLGIIALVSLALTGCEGAGEWFGGRNSASVAGSPDTALNVVRVRASATSTERGTATEAGAPPALNVTAQTPGAGQSLSNSRETAVVRAAESVSPSVVAVHVLRTQQVRVADPFDPFSIFGGSFFGRSTTRRVPSLGSGFVVDAAGIVLTNDHVVRGAEEILVTFPDGRDARAQLVGSDETTDVAVLRIDGGNLVAAPIGRSSDLRIGEWVIAFGNPFGNLLSNPEPTVTVGVTSAIGRHIVPTEDDGGFYLGMIQTDAAINPGNSGGPLVNADGEVVGMNASIFSRSGGSEGMGFAIPIERALRIAEDLIQFGQVRRAWVGLNVEPDSADAFGRTRGVRVAGVAPSSPGDRGAIRPGDRLLAVNGRRLVTPLDLDAALLDLRAGDVVSVEVDGRPNPIRLTAVEIPSQVAERVRIFDGLDLVTLTPAIRAERRIVRESGALVVRVTSREVTETLGLRAGDLIIGVNRQPVRSAEELSSFFRTVQPGTTVQLIVERNGQQLLSPGFSLR